MKVVDGALKGKLVNARTATTAGDGADGSSLTDGSYMFYECSGLTSWTVDLPNLTTSTYMFYNCSNLTSFSGDLPNLTNATTMFANCTGLTSWTVDLPKLTSGASMFSGCKLDESSILCVLNSIPTYTSGSHSLHLGKNTNYKDSTDIATLLGTTTPIAARSTYKYKGWTITITT